MLASPILARRSAAVMEFETDIDGSGRVPRVTHFSRSPRLRQGYARAAQRDGNGAVWWPEPPSEHRMKRWLSGMFVVLSLVTSCWAQAAATCISWMNSNLPSNRYPTQLELAQAVIRNL